MDRAGRARLSYSCRLVAGCPAGKDGLTPHAYGIAGVKPPDWLHTFCKPCCDTYALCSTLESKRAYNATVARGESPAVLKCESLDDFHSLYTSMASCDYCRTYRTGLGGCTSSGTALCDKVPRCESCGAKVSCSGKDAKKHTLDAYGSIRKCNQPSDAQCRYCAKYRKGLVGCTSPKVLECAKVPTCDICRTKVTLTGEQWRNHTCDNHGAIVRCNYRCSHCGTVGEHNSKDCAVSLQDKCSYCRRFRTGEHCGSLSIKTCPHAPICPVCLRKGPHECMDAEGGLAACGYTCTLCGDTGTHRAHIASATCSGLFCSKVETAGGRCGYCAKFESKQCGASKQSHCKVAPICPICERTATCIDTDGNAAPCNFVCPVCGGQHKAFQGRHNTNVVYCPVMYPDGVQGYRCGHCDQYGHNIHGCADYKADFMNDQEILVIGEKAAERLFREHIAKTCATCGEKGHEATTCTRPRDPVGVHPVAVRRVLDARGISSRGDAEADKKRARALVDGELEMHAAETTAFVGRQERIAQRNNRGCHNMSRLDTWLSSAVNDGHYTAVEFSRLCVTRQGRARIRQHFHNHQSNPMDAIADTFVGCSFMRRTFQNCWRAWKTFVGAKRRDKTLRETKREVKALEKRDRTMRDPLSSEGDSDALRTAKRKLDEIRTARSFIPGPAGHCRRPLDHGNVPAQEFAQALPTMDRATLQLCRLWNSDPRMHREDAYQEQLQRYREQDYKRLKSRNMFTAADGGDMAAGMDRTIPTFVEASLSDGTPLTFRRVNLLSSLPPRGGLRNTLTLRPAGDLQYRVVRPAPYEQMRQQKRYREHVRRKLRESQRTLSRPQASAEVFTEITSFYDGTVLE